MDASREVNGGMAAHHERCKCANARQGQGTQLESTSLPSARFWENGPLPLGDGGQWVIKLYGGGGLGGEADPLRMSLAKACPE